MPRRMYQVLNIQKGMKGWTVLVQVVERCHPQFSHSTPPKKYVRLLLTDSEGTKVSAVIYANDVRYFANLLWPFKRYYISNATVNFTAPNYRVSEFADTEKLQNIKAVVVHAFPIREHGVDLSRTRDFVVVNEEKIPMLLTMWNEFEAYDGVHIANTIMTGPMIIAMRVKVTTFSSLSLTTRMSSCLLINPPLPEDMMLRDWFNVNRAELNELVQAKAYRDPSRLLPPPKEEDIVNVGTALATLQDVKTAWVKGNAKLTPGQQRYWYTACNNCHKSINAEADWEIKCPSCKEETKVDIRCRMGILLEDETGSLTASIFSPDCERLIQLTAFQLKEADDNGASLDKQLAISIEKHSIVAFIRYYDRDFQGQLSRRHSMVKAYTVKKLAQLPAAVNDEDMPLIVATYQAPEHQPDKIAPEEHQFFTPTAKKLLEEISGASNETLKATRSMTGVKRNLPFTDPTSQAKVEIKEDVVGLTAQPSSKALAAENAIGED